MRVHHVSAIAAVLLMGSAVGVAGQEGEGCVDEECILAEFSGSLRFDMTCDGVDSTGLTCEEPAVLVPFSDPRLDADVAITGWFRDIGDGSMLWLGSWLIGDSDAGWVEVASPRLQHGDGTPTQYTSVLVGTGAYEGLHAVSEVTVSGADFDLDGHIVAGRLEPGVTDFSGVVTPGDTTELDW